MRTRLRCVLWLAFLLYAAASLGQTATVVHNVNLRHDPSTTNPPIRLLHPPEVVTLIEPTKTAGYYHVHTAANEDGWVWGPNVNVQVTPAPTPTPAGPAAGQPASQVDPSWPKDTPVEITFHTASGTCGPDGDTSGDPSTNHLKNRVDVPATYHAVTFDAMLKLPILPAGSPTTRTSPNWPTVAPLVTPLEGAPLSVEGFIVKVKKETSGEKTNCKFTQPTEIDWHVPLVTTATDPENLSVVVELTPRVRKNHPNWTEGNLTPSGPKPLFRISGWLLYDPDHPGHLFDPAHPKPKRYRRTLWELHPVTKIEVQQAGAWKDLDHP